jgi:alpha-beta hydrolase superfamily lysophospholipase
MIMIFRHKLVRYVLLPLIGVFLLGLIGGGWYFSSVLEEDGLRVDNTPDEFTITVAEIGTGSISLRQPEVDKSETLGFSAIWGLTDGQNYGQVGAVLSESDEIVTREFSVLSGDFEIGDKVRLDRSSYPPDPKSAHDLEYEEVLIAAPLGDIGAWYVPGDSDIWAVLVHGRTSNRESSLKLLDDFASIGIATLTIDYRNDEGAPASESGYYDFGTTEWEDVDAAVAYALQNGASRILLVGYSMGGGIVVSHQLRSEFADKTVGIILDAPMLNFGRTVDKGAEERSVPAPITFAAKIISSIRFGVDWSALDFLARADEIDVPVLMFHGDADDTVPIETSIEFADAIPELAELHTYPDVGHVAAWNHHRDEYERLIEEFVERIR